MRFVHVVGCEGYARTLIDEARRYAGMGECRLGAVVVDPVVNGADRATERTRELTAQGWQVYPTLPALVADHWPQSRQSGGPRDLLCLPLPINLHLPFVRSGLEAGFDVLCEKPAAGTVAEIREMQAIEARSEGSLFFGFQHVLTDALQNVSELLARGAADGTGPGRLLAARGLVLWPRRDSYYRRNSWAGRLEVAGPDGRQQRILDSPLQNATAHFLHALLETSAAAGWRPAAVHAEHLRARAEIDSADLQALQVELKPLRPGAAQPGPSPVITCIAAHCIDEQQDPLLQWDCQGGRITWSFPDTLTVELAGAPPQVVEGGLSGPELNAVALRRALRTDLPPGARRGVTAESALLHTAVLEAAFTGVTPVNPVPLAPGVTTAGGGREDDRQLVIPGVAEAARQGFDQGRLLAAKLPGLPFRCVEAPVLP